MGNIAEMTSHGFNKLCIVKAFNRKMKIHIAWQSRKNRMLVWRVRLIIKLIAMSQQLLRMTSRVKFSEDMMRIWGDEQAKILFLEEKSVFSLICDKYPETNQFKLFYTTI